MSSKGRPISLESSLSRLLSLLLLGVLLVLLAIAAWIGRESAIQFALSRLHHDAEAIITHLDLTHKRLDGGLSPIYRQPLSGHYYLVRFADGSELRSRSLWDEPFPVRLPASPEPRYWLADGPQDQRLLIWQQRYEKDGQPFAIAIAEDVAPLLAAIWRFIAIGVVASLAAVLLMAVLQRLLVRRAFARLDQVREDVWAVRQGQRQSVGTEAVPAEVLPIVSEFNQLLEAWRRHRERLRNAVGNLAHALKTPLQLILRHGEQGGDPQVVEQARRMQGLIEQELKRARLTGRTLVGHHFRPREDLTALVETIETLYHHKALKVTARIDAPDCLPLDQNDMLELLGNLLDNAAKWAETRIDLRLWVADGRLHLELEDDGPGIDEGQQARLLERGIRLDENHPGHGLGLAIVGDILDLYGGRITLGRSRALGGLQVAVNLPLE